jgi:hypothetical protein
MQVSYFETARYQVPPTVPTEWPVPPGLFAEKVLPRIRDV